MNTIDIKSVEKKKVSLVEKAKDLKKVVLENATALADRILNKAIAREEQEKAWSKRKDELKKVMDDKRKQAAIAKRERKNKQRLLLNKTIPFAQIDKKDTEEKKENYKNFILSVEKNQKELEQKRVERIEKQKKKAKQKLHHKEAKITKKTTKEERILAAIEKKKEGKAGYKKELQRQSSEILADREGYKDRQLEKQKKEAERLERLVARRKEKLAKSQIRELSFKEKIKKTLEHFKQAQLARDKKREEKRAKYLTKGGKEIPKVKNKVETRVNDTSRLTKIKMPELSKYSVIVSNITTEGNILNTVPITICCKPNTLSDHLKNIHNKHMKLNPDSYVGTFAYREDNTEHCIYEMINNKYLSIAGKLTSRIAQQRKSA